MSDRKRSCALLPVVLTAGVLLSHGPAFGQAGCYSCGYNNTRCVDYQTSGMSGCDDSGGQCNPSGSQCGDTGGGGDPTDPVREPIHHGAGMPKEEASDATFARLLVGAVFTVPAEGGAG